jgi:peptide/nickel transport system permease protein
MVAAAARRVFFMVLVLAGASFASFVFFWKTDLPLKGQPWGHGYHLWLSGLWSGRSYRGLFTQTPLWPQFGTALAHTAVLLGGSLLVVVPACIAVAAIAAWRRDGALDVSLRAFAYTAWAIPPFLLALIVTLVATSFGNHFAIGPFGAGGWPGTCTPGFDFSTGRPIPCPALPSALQHAFDVARALVLPCLALAAGFVGVHSRQLRASLLQTLELPFITTARSKGMNESRIFFRHALRLSISTFISSLFADVGAVFGAALAVDAVFGLGGLGTLLIRLFPVNGFAPIDVYSVQLLLLITGAFILASGLVADGVLAWLDPRQRRDA